MVVMQERPRMRPQTEGACCDAGEGHAPVREDGGVERFFGGCWWWVVGSAVGRREGGGWLGCGLCSCLRWWHDCLWCWLKICWMLWAPGEVFSFLSRSCICGFR